MFSPDTLAEVPEFIEKQKAKWKRIEGTIPGLQLIVSGERQSTYVIAISTDEIHEHVTIGQLPHVVLRPSSPRRGAELADMPNDRKPFDRRRVDLSDHMIDTILELWRHSKSAAVMPSLKDNMVIWSKSR